LVRSSEDQAHLPKGNGVKINNGKNVSFWLDPWIDEMLLYQKYPMLYELAVK
jgi:hypothetical protein